MTIRTVPSNIFRQVIIFARTVARPNLALKVLVDQNRFAEAVAALRQGTEAIPDDPRLRNELARLLATSPDTGTRNESRAPALYENRAPSAFRLHRTTTAITAPCKYCSPCVSFSESLGVQPGHSLSRPIVSDAEAVFTDGFP